MLRHSWSIRSHFADRTDWKTEVGGVPFRKVSGWDELSDGGGRAGLEVWLVAWKKEKGGGMGLCTSTNKLRIVFLGKRKCLKGLAYCRRKDNESRVGPETQYVVARLRSEHRFHFVICTVCFKISRIR